MSFSDIISFSFTVTVLALILIKIKHIAVIDAGHVCCIKITFVDVSSFNDYCLT